MHRISQGLTQAHIAHHMMAGQIRTRGLQKHHDVIVAPISWIRRNLMRERHVLRKSPTQKSLGPNIPKKKRKAIPQPSGLAKCRAHAGASPAHCTRHSRSCNDSNCNHFSALPLSSIR
jgi:hypothetical protein